MIIDKKVEVIKEGVTPHKCGDFDWVRDFNGNTPEGVLEYSRICKVCGRLEKVTEKHEITTFSEVCEKFHGEVK